MKQIQPTIFWLMKTRILSTGNFLTIKFYFMAHNINRNAKTGQDAFFSVKEKAWHNLGKIVQNYPTSEEAILYAGLNYEVEKRTLYSYGKLTDGSNGELLKINTHFATVRQDTEQFLGIVGGKYEVVQNRTAFTFFDALVNDGSGIKYETAGALGNGERIFITAKMPEVMKIGRNDIIELYIFLTTSHDGSGSIMAALTPTRIVCNNTLNMALRNATNSVFIKHTANAEMKLKEAARIISITNDTSADLERLFNKWSRVRLSDAEVKKLVQLSMSPNKEVFTAIVTGDEKFEFSAQYSNIVDDIFEYAQSADSQQMDTTKNTLFGVYNAITGYYQNVKSFKNDDAKLNSIMYGTALDKTQAAFNICKNASDFLN